jgi:PKD repeat protein
MKRQAKENPRQTGTGIKKWRLFLVAISVMVMLSGAAVTLISYQAQHSTGIFAPVGFQPMVSTGGGDSYIDEGHIMDYQTTVSEYAYQGVTVTDYLTVNGYTSPSQSWTPPYNPNSITVYYHTFTFSYTWPSNSGSSGGTSYGWNIHSNTAYTASGTTYVYTPPSISGLSGTSSIDASQMASFSVSSESGGSPSLTYYWNFGDGSTTTTSSSSASHTYTSAGTYTVSVFVEDSSGVDSNTLTTSITVKSDPSITISSSHNPSDSGQTVDFSTAVSGGSGTYSSYSYVLYDGTSTSDSQLASGSTSSFSYTFSSTGQFLLDYSVTDSNGYTQSTSLTQTVNSDPSVSISSSQNPTDSGKTVEFTSSVSGGTPGYTYSWTIDGDSYTSQDVNFTFSSSGTYTVDLTITDAAGYSVSTSLSETVNSDPTVSASSNVSTADVGYPIEFSSAPSGGTGGYTYSWTLNGNQISTSQDFSYSFSSSGTYTLTVTITDSVGKTTTASVTVSIHSNPSISISSSQNPSDVGNSVTFSSSETGGTGALTYSWLVNGLQESTSPSFSYSFSSASTYYINVTVVDSDGHSASYSLKETVNPDPSVTIHASHNPSDAGIAVNFTSSIAGGTPGYTYAWTINGENYSTPYVNYTFTSPGTYSVSLQITDKNGNTASDQIEEVVNPDPTVVIDAQYTRVDQGVNDTLYASISGGTSPFNYTWSIGFHILNYSQEFHLNFTSLGTYTVNLTVVDSLGESTSSSITITVIERPSAAIEGSNETDISTSTYWEGYGSYGTAPYEYYWYINGVNTSAGLYLHYSFPKAGTYNISLLIIDADGAKANTYLDVRVNQLPTISVSSSAGSTDIGKSIIFNSSISGGSPFFNYTWRISSLGFVGYESSLVYDFTSPGTYNVTVTVADGAGNSASASITVTIHRLPVPLIKAEYPNIDVNVTDSFNSNVSGGTAPYTYTWSINGVYEGNGTSLSYAFSTSGIFTVELLISDSAGSTASYSEDISVQAYPVASIIASRSSIDANVTDTFRASGTGGVGPYTYEWIIGGHTFSNSTVSYSFGSSGNYTVQLVIVDSFGKDASTATVITVFPDPQVSVNRAGNPIVSVPFHMSANIIGGIAPYSMSWIFPSGQHETGLSISHVFSSSGPETFEVAVSDSGGYSGTKNFTIDVGLFVSIAANTTSGLGPLSVQFSSSVLGGSAYSYNWTFSPGHHSLEQNPEYVFPVGNYTVSFKVTSANGATGEKNITITSLPPPVSLNSSSGLNITQAFSFRAIPNWDASGPYNMSWSFPNGQTLSGLNISYKFPVYNELNIVIATFSYGNGKTWTQELTVRMNPANPVISFSSPKIIPTGTMLALNASASAPDSSTFSYSWVINGSTYTGQDQLYYFSSPGNYTISVTVTDSLGASSSVTRTIEVLPQGTNSSIGLSYTKNVKGPMDYFTVKALSTNGIIAVEAFLGTSELNVSEINSTYTPQGELAYFNITFDQREYTAGTYSVDVVAFNNNSQSNRIYIPFLVSSQYSSSLFSLGDIISFFGGISNFIITILTLGGLVIAWVSLKDSRNPDLIVEENTGRKPKKIVLKGRSEK